MDEGKIMIAKKLQKKFKGNYKENETLYLQAKENDRNGHKFALATWIKRSMNTLQTKRIPH